MYGSYNHQLSLSLSCSVSFALCLTFYNFHFSNPAEWKFPGTTSCANIFQLSRSLPLSVSFLFLFLTPFQYAFSINLTPYPIVGICIRSDLNLSLFFWKKTGFLSHVKTRLLNFWGCGWLKIWFVPTRFEHFFSLGIFRKSPQLYRPQTKKSIEKFNNRPLTISLIPK